MREGRRREFRHFAAFEDADSRAPHPRPERSPRPSRPRRSTGPRRDTAEGRDWLAYVADAPRHPPPRDRAPPRRAPPATAAASLAADDGLIAVDWRLDGADLRLRANLTETPPLPPPPRAGRVIHGDAAPTPLPPFAVLVALEERR